MWFSLSLVLPLTRHVIQSSLYILLQTATCLRMLNELRDAVDVYEYSASTVFLCSSFIYCLSLVRLVEPTHNEAKMKLAEIYEILNEPRKALDLVYEGRTRFPFYHRSEISLLTSY